MEKEYKNVNSKRNNPQPRTTVGAASGFLRVAYYFFPTLSRNITSAAIRAYLKQAHSIENTSGNVLHAVEYGNGIDGGWGNTSLSPSLRTKRLLLFAGIAVGFIILSRK